MRPAFTYGFMDYYYPGGSVAPASFKSEMSAVADADFMRTDQWEQNGKTSWQHFKDRYHGRQYGAIRTRIRTPEDIGLTSSGQFVPGPNEYQEARDFPAGPMVTFVGSHSSSVRDLQLKVLLEVADPDNPGQLRRRGAANADVVLYASDAVIDMGGAANDGLVQVLGAADGDQIQLTMPVKRAVSPFSNDTRTLFKEITVASGGAEPIEVVLGEVSANEAAMLPSVRPVSQTLTRIIALGASLLAPQKIVHISPEGGRQDLDVQADESGFSADLDGVSEGEHTLLFQYEDVELGTYSQRSTLHVIEVKDSAAKRRNVLAEYTATDGLTLDLLDGGVEQIQVLISDARTPTEGLVDSLRRVSRVYAIETLPTDEPFEAVVAIPYSVPASIVANSAGFRLMQWAEESGWMDVESVQDPVGSALRATVAGSGVFAVFNDVSVTGTPTEPSAGVSDGVMLSENYPNPFAVSSRFDLTLDQSSRVTLEVVDMLGRSLGTVISTRLNRGEHPLDLNAPHLPPGIYSAVITVGEVRFVRVFHVIR